MDAKIKKQGRLDFATRTILKLVGVIVLDTVGLAWC